MKNTGYHIGQGLGWLGFWIGLGLYNFQGCVPHFKEAAKISTSWEEKTK